MPGPLDAVSNASHDCGIGKKHARDTTLVASQQLAYMPQALPVVERHTFVGIAGCKDGLMDILSEVDVTSFPHGENKRAEGRKSEIYSDDSEYSLRGLRGAWKNCREKQSFRRMGYPGSCLTLPI